MQVAGSNEFSQLCAEPNNKSAGYYPVISPPVQSRLDVSRSLSYSVYRDHAVWITREMKAHAVGDNSNGRITGDLPFDRLESESEFQIHDKQEKSYDLISAVCGSWYTLYLIQPPNSPEVKLAYVVYNKNDGVPLFLNISGRKPIGLFGGETRSAAIDSNGSIILIAEDIFDLPDPIPQFFSLPGDEKAVSVACCNQFIAALSNNGVVYLSALDEGKFTDFAEVPTLTGIKCVDISGTFEHCLAVTDDGRVFGLGSNYNGALGLGRKVKKAEKFREIKFAEGVKIKGAFAGFNDSLFLTEEGQVLSCGSNSCGQLLMNIPPSTKCVQLPKETAITEGASFCIAGYSLSAVFVGSEPPPYSPNKKISEELLEKQRKLAQELLDTGIQINITKLPSSKVNEASETQGGDLENTISQTVDRALTTAETQPDDEEKKRKEEEEERKRNEQAKLKQNQLAIENKATENFKNEPTPPPEPEKSKCCLLI